MFTHPDLMWSQQKQHRSELLADADSHRLLAAARRRWRTRGESASECTGG